MKTLKIQSESAKGLFTDQKSQNDLAGEVRKLILAGEQQIKVTEVINNSQKELIITGYLERGATSKDSSFTYICGEKKYICGGIRKYFGLPTYSKPGGRKTFEVKNLSVATDEELQRLISDASALLQERAEKAKEEKAKDKARRAALAKLTAAERAALGL